MKTILKVYTCDEHDQKVCYLNDKCVFQNDYCVENVYRIAKHLGWKVEIITLSRNEYEEKFA